MDIQDKNFIKILSAYINQRTYLNVKNIDIEKIYELSVLHNLSTILYIELKKNNYFINETIYEKLKQNFYTTIKYSIIQEQTALELLEILNKNKIKHIIFKGFVLRDYYPDKEVRTMGDIDIVIESQCQNKVHQILLDSGFIFDEASSKQEVFNYKKNNVLFEIHTKIIKTNLTKKYNFEKYFSDNFSHAVKINNFTCEFNKEHHFIYLITHMAKHFKFSGFGVRMLLDISMFVKHCYTELDWKKIKKELETLGLFEFTACILKICCEWFETPLPDVFYDSINTENIKAMEDYIITGGVFGYNNRNIDAMRITKENSSFVSRLLHMTRLIFPSYEFLVRRYVWAGNMPKCLLPLIWIRLWYYRVFVLKENSFKRVFKGLKDSEDTVEHYKLMNILGLE